MMAVFAILGLGEAGGALATDLIRLGVTVYGWDPEPKQIPTGVHFAANNPDAAARADVILSVNLATVALEVAEEVLPFLRPDQLYADLNTAAPHTKQQIADVMTPSGALFADVALMAPVLPRGIGTPAMASGLGAQKFHDFLTGYGMPVTVLDQPAGSAATRKLVRSVFYKGVAAVVIECLEAARQLDCEAWARAQMSSILSDEQMIDRFVNGSHHHAERRIHEMTAVTELLHQVGVAAYTSQAALDRLHDIQKEKVLHE
jgi:3-hydroxyisobutyrate dehydrogenase-like beta-hydroxyacid dehydrogenase